MHSRSHGIELSCYGRVIIAEQEARHYTAITRELNAEQEARQVIESMSLLYNYMHAVTLGEATYISLTSLQVHVHLHGPHWCI